jgi:hypothetical protein
MSGRCVGLELNDLLLISIRQPSFATGLLRGVMRGAILARHGQFYLSFTANPPIGALTGNPPIGALTGNPVIGAFTGNPNEGPSIIRTSIVCEDPE